MQDNDQYSWDEASYKPASDRRGDPLHSDKHGWWFFDETWSDRHGPYADEETARAELERYAAAL